MILVCVYCLVIWSSIFTPTETSAGKNFTLERFYNLMTGDKNDFLGDVPGRGNLGIKASPLLANLGDKPDLFRVRRPGFRKINGSLALESTLYPGHYLRYKNYKFHLEKPQPHAVFAKDATFIGWEPLGQGSIAFEISGHNNWFLCHGDQRPYNLKAATREAEDTNFDRDCVFVTEQQLTQQNIKKISENRGGITTNQGAVTKNQTQIVTSKINSAEPAKTSSLNSSNQSRLSEINLTKSTILTAKTPNSTSTQNVSSQTNIPLKKLNQNPSAVNMPLLNPSQVPGPVQTFYGQTSPWRPLGMQRKWQQISPNFVQHQVGPQSPMQAMVIKPKPFSLYGGKPGGFGQTGQRAKLQPLNTASWLKPRPAVQTHAQAYIKPYIRTQQQQRFQMPLSRLPYRNTFHRQTNNFMKSPVQQKPATLQKQFQYNPKPFQVHSLNQQIATHAQKLFRTLTRRPQTHYSTVAAKRVFTTPVATIKPQEGMGLSNSRNVLPAHNFVSMIRQPQTHLPAFTAKPVLTTPVAVANQQESTDANESGIAVLKTGNGSQVKPPLGYLDFNNIQNNIRPDIGDKCIQLRFINELRKPVKVVSSMKPEGYLVTAETFKLKTIFKHPKKNRHVVFYAKSVGREVEDVVLNKNNLLTVRPGACDRPYTTVAVARAGLDSTPEVNLLKLPALGPAANQRSPIGPAANQRGPTGLAANQRVPTAQFTQWSLFGPCSRTCGKSFQSRARRCLARYAFVCKGTTVESRECYMRPCPVVETDALESSRTEVQLPAPAAVTQHLTTVPSLSLAAALKQISSSVPASSSRDSNDSSRVMTKASSTGATKALSNGVTKAPLSSVSKASLDGVTKAIPPRKHGEVKTKASSQHVKTQNTAIASLVPMRKHTLITKTSSPVSVPHTHHRTQASKKRRLHSSTKCTYACAKHCKASCPRACCRTKVSKASASLNLT